MKLDILKFKLQQTLQNNIATRRKLSTTWRIEPSRLAHYKTSKNLYSQPIPNTGKKYKCDLLLDVSNSMYDHRMNDALKSVQNLIKLFHGIVDFRVVVFWNGFYQMSVNEILSITPDKSYMEYKAIFGRATDIKIDKQGKKNITPCEGGTLTTDYGTWWPAVIGHSYETMLSEDGERFIIFITDGQDCMHPFSSAESGSSLSSYIDKMCWMDVRQWSPENYPTILSTLKDEGINILPIGIDINISKNFPEAINLSSPDDIYEETIKFVDRAFS